MSNRDLGECGTASDARESGAGRLALYQRMFGPLAERSPDPEPGAGPAIDVCVFRPGFAGREFYTLATSGMSDAPMAVPAEAAGVPRRAELALYVDLPTPGLVRLVRSLARLPHRTGQWLGPGHTLPNGDPPALLFPEVHGCVLDTVLVLESIVAPEKDLRELLAVDGEPVAMLWPLPISGAECQVKLEQGTSALLALFNAVQLSFVLDPARPSYA